MLVYVKTYLCLAVKTFFEEHLPCCGILDYIRVNRKCFFFLFFFLEKMHVSISLSLELACIEHKGAPRGFGDLGRTAFYFQGVGEHW